ncbi:Vacuolar protein sorting-associated protein 53 [Borealophlyctis nickersoniae]|nr:Vacuolar protein sorting-associated protein 53 [Borealophlyctis nickersoniae]
MRHANLNRSTLEPGREGPEPSLSVSRSRQKSFKMASTQDLRPASSPAQPSGPLGGTSLDGADEFEEGGRHETIRIEPDLDHAISNILQTKDTLDSSDFDPIEYINLIFPNEHALATVDNVLQKLRLKIGRMDKEIRDLVRSQTIAGQQSAADLEEAKRGIQELYRKIKAIKEKAAQSEQMVQEITRDIKSLDQAKKNLTVSVTVLKRLQMLVSAVDQLRAMAGRRQYSETAQLLQVISQLLLHFKTYRSVNQIAALLDHVSQLQNDLKRQIFGEFEGAFGGGTLRTQINLLNEACLVVEILEGDAKKNLIDWYCELELKDYRGIFRNNPEVAGLGDVSRRYAWLKRLLKTYDDEHAGVFPVAWRVAESLCEKFCLDTRRDLSEQLAKVDQVMDVKIMLQALQQTMDFEAKLDKRFTLRDYEEGGANNSDQSQPLPGSKFYKIISSCFEPYLRHYIDSEDKALSGLMETYRARPILSEEESVLASSTDLFYSYRQTLVQFSKLSTRKPFLDLCKMFGKWLRVYGDMLSSKVPKDEKKAITEDEIKTICLIINTADYCATTISQLEEKLIEKIDEEFKSLLNFSTERDNFLGVCGTGIKALVQGIENSVEPAMTAMAKKAWGTVESVGDQSDYVNLIASTLSTLVGVAKRNFATNKYFRTFCDKFSEGFLTRYYNNIFRCKPINEVGAEQMLLDTHALKTILIQMTNIGAEGPAQPPPATYVKLLNKGVTKVEQLLKVVLRPYEPVEGIVETYLLLFNDHSVANFQRVVELKGLKRTEQQNVIDAFQRRIAAAEGTAGGATNAAPAGSSFANTFAGLSTSSKFNVDMRKFVATMNMKRG